MKTLRIKLYTFDELTAAAKKVAIEQERQDYMENGDRLAGFVGYCIGKAKAEGFNDIKVGYSLSYCQGDGLSFSCKDFELNTFIDQNVPEGKKLLRKVLKEWLVYELKGNKGNYAFAAKSDVDLYLNYPKRDYVNLESVVVNDLLTKLESKYMTLCKELEKTGYEWLENANEDEQVIERIRENEYDYLESGKRFSLSASH